jgi:hypothetical protein
MKRFFLISYRYRDSNDEDDLRHLTKKFVEFGTGTAPLAHYERLDGRGGFMVRELDDDPVQQYELTVRYSPYMEFEVVPVTTMEEAFPVINGVYG